MGVSRWKERMLRREDGRDGNGKELENSAFKENKLMIDAMGPAGAVTGTVKDPTLLFFAHVLRLYFSLLGFCQSITIVCVCV